MVQQLPLFDAGRQLTRCEQALYAMMNAEVLTVQKSGGSLDGKRVVVVEC